MNLRDLLVDLNKEFYGYKNDIFFTKFLKRTIIKTLLDK